MDLQSIANMLGCACPKADEVLRTEQMAALPAHTPAIYGPDTPTCALCGRFSPEMRVGHCGCAFCVRCAYEELPAILISHCPQCCGELYPMRAPDEELQARIAKQKVVCRNHQMLTDELGCTFSARTDDPKLARHERECFGKRASVVAELRSYLLDDENSTPVTEKSNALDPEAVHLSPPGKAVKVHPSFVSPVVSRLFGQPTRAFAEVPRARAPVIVHLILDRMWTQAAEVWAGPG